MVNDTHTRRRIKQVWLCDYIGNSTHKRKIICNLLNSAMTNEFVTMKIIAATANISKFNISKNVVCHNVDSVLESA